MSSHEEMNESDVPASLLERITFRTLLEMLIEVSIFSFIISEAVFFYLLRGGISRFPENVVVGLIVLSIGLGLISIFAHEAVVFLTSATSVLTIIAIVNFLLGSSTDPHFLPISNTLQGDFLFGLIGALGWVALLTSASNFLRKRKISKSQAYVLLSLVEGSVLFYFAYVYSELVIIFFDQHPWFATLLVGVSSSVAAYIIGRGRRK